MSHTTGYLLGVDGLMQPDREWSNGMLGALTLWTYLARTYLDPRAPRGTDRYMLPSAQLFVPDVSRRLWALAGNSSVRRHHRIALMTTFDRAILRRADFVAAADALESAADDVQRGGSQSHLAAQARWLNSVAEREDVAGAGWQQTSVSDDLWRVAGDLDDEGCEGDSRPYDIARDQGHWFIELPGGL